MKPDFIITCTRRDHTYYLCSYNRREGALWTETAKEAKVFKTEDAACKWLKSHPDVKDGQVSDLAACVSVDQILASWGKL